MWLLGAHCFIPRDQDPLKPIPESINFFALLRTEETIRDAMRCGAELTSCALKTYGRRKKRSSAMEQVYRCLPSGKAAFYRSEEEEGLCACHVLSVSSLETWEPLQVLSCPTPFEAALSKPVASLGSSDSAASYILCTFFYILFLQTPTVYHRNLSAETEESKTFQRQRHRHGHGRMFDTQ